VPALCRALADGEGFVRRAAAVALGSIGPVAGAAVPALVRLLINDPDTDVTWAAAEALRAIGAAEAAVGAVPNLVGPLRDKDGTARVAAARALGALGPVARLAVPELIRALGDRGWGDASQDIQRRYAGMPVETLDLMAGEDQRMHLPAVLRRIGPPEAVIPALAEAVADPVAFVADAAAAELRELLPASEPALRALLDHPDEAVRARAESALAP
jgi:HEAT repeat protein